MQFYSGITSSIISIGTSLPFLIYFLGFINYFTIHSLYVLLNFAIPEQLFLQLSTIYNGVNQNLLQFFGI
jgi:hypothetical protein